MQASPAGQRDGARPPIQTMIRFIHCLTGHVSLPEIERVLEESLSVYGLRKLWPQRCREGFDIARGSVARLMTDIGGV